MTHAHKRNYYHTRTPYTHTHTRHVLGLRSVSVVVSLSDCTHASQEERASKIESELTMKEEIMKKLVEEMIRRVMNVEDRAAKLEAELQRRQKEDLYAAADNSNLISLILSSLSLSLLCLSAYLC